MPDILDSAEVLHAIRTYLSAPATVWQAAIVALGALLAWLAGRSVQRRLAPAIRPGAITGTRRTAMHTGMLVLIPLMLWLWLIVIAAVFARLHLEHELLRLTALLAGAFALIRMGVFILRHSLSPGGWLKTWEGTLTVVIWGWVALHLLGWLPHVEKALDEYALNLGQVRISLLTVVSFVLSMALLWLLALGLANVIRQRVMESRALEASFKVAIANLVRFTLLFLAVVVAMVAAGIDITALAVFGGALGVGLGLGLQRVVSNFVSGIILAFEGSLRPGDIIGSGSTLGVVRALHARHVVVRDQDGRDILIPNEHLLTTEITNLTYGDRNVRLRLPVQIGYQDDPEKAIALLERIGREHPGVLPEPAPAAWMQGLGDNGVQLELFVWTAIPPEGLGPIRSELYRRIWKEFHAAGIAFPAPQREVRLVTPAAAAARSRDSAGSPRGSARGRSKAPRAGSPD